MKHIVKKMLRSLTNFLELSINSNTEPGDKVTFIVKYQGKDKPQVTLELSGLSQTIKSVRKTSFDLTPYLRDKPSWTGEDGSINGFRDWRDYIETYVAAEAKSICNSGMRMFDYKVE